jgi:hypothetical protein
MNSVPVGDPKWQALYDIAASQDGLFTTRQAAAAGYSDPLLAHHQKVGRIARIRRGIYRLVHFPTGGQEELVSAWLWTDAMGVLVATRPFRCAAGTNSSDPTADMETTAASRPERPRAPLRRCTGTRSIMERRSACNFHPPHAQRLRSRGPLSRSAPPGYEASPRPRAGDEGGACRC